MKSFASKFNKTTFDIDTTDFQYTKLADIFNSENEGGKDVVHKINGLYVHKSQLDDSPVIIDEENKRLVNLPSHTAKTVREILADAEAVETIKDGKVGYTIYEYESHGKKCYSISFVDL
ncbi:MAG: hypothetical protein [Bacteriophage sp.]|nr:MAG: hypothetical protein [Bacteriophage sp.]